MNIIGIDTYLHLENICCVACFIIVNYKYE